jgi:hypothetical protein
VPKTARIRSTTGESDQVVEIAAVEIAAPETELDSISGPETDSLDPAQGQPFARFRRRIERFRGDADTQYLPDGLDDVGELRVQLMLLREENARLKASRHQPASAGSAIDRVRLLATAATEAEAQDDAWSLLAECLMIREGLDQTCAEFQGAISSVRDRLAAITLRLESSLPAAGSEVDEGTDQLKA